MGLPSQKIDEFYRYFPISGMGHCSGGDGAYAIGNQLITAGSLEAEDNVLVRMVEWVEGGEKFAPEWVRGVRWVNVSTLLLALWGRNEQEGDEAD